MAKILVTSKKVVFFLVIVAVIVYLCARLFKGIGKTPSKKMQDYYAKKNELYYGGKFHNEHETKMNMAEYKRTNAKEITPANDINVIEISEFPKPDKDKTTVTWFGHSCLLIQMSGKNILTDPALTKYSSPVNFIGVKRFSKVPISLENLPQIDVMLISHDHYDHLDYQTIKKVDKKVKKYIVPLGVESYLKGWGIKDEKISSLNWWEEESDDDITFTSIPAQHFSMRNPLKKDATLWCGFVIGNKENTLYFTGDTGYNKAFKEVYHKFGSIDLFMADTGQYNEAWKNVHMSPYDALQAAKDVDAKYYMPIHWGAFVLSNHDWYEPAEVVTNKKEEYEVNVVTPRIGDIVDIKDIEEYTNKWWND